MIDFTIDGKTDVVICKKNISKPNGSDKCSAFFTKTKYITNMDVPMILFWSLLNILRVLF